MSCIYYPVKCQKKQVKALLNSSSKVNTISSGYAKKLKLKVWQTNVKAQKINDSVLKTFEIVITDFQIENKANRPRFFPKIFLVANIKFEIILGMFFLKFNNADMPFDGKILMQKTYTTNKALSTIEQVQIINKKNFVIVALNIDNKMFVIYMIIQEQKKMLVYFKRQAQIKAQNETQVGALLFNKAFIKVLAKYFNYNNIFLVENIVELPENTGINEHAIKLKKDKQQLFGLIYSLKLVELETLKTYIKIILANDFIRYFKSFIRASILFNKKSNRSFCLNVDY